VSEIGYWGLDVGGIRYGAKNNQNTKLANRICEMPVFGHVQSRGAGWPNLLRCRPRTPLMTGLTHDQDRLTGEPPGLNR
jgi:hypothetical protein